MSVNKGLRKRPRLTQSAYRAAVSETVRHLQGEDSDQDLADAWGVSAGTVCNARNKKGDLTAIPLLKLGDNFGLDALDTVAALIGGRVVPVDAVALDVSAIPHDVAACLPMLIDCFRDGECSEDDVRTLERAGVIDCLSKVAKMLCQSRDALRVRAA